jgi:hypothetical protein
MAGKVISLTPFGLFITKHREGYYVVRETALKALTQAVQQVDEVKLSRFWIELHYHLVTYHTKILEIPYQVVYVSYPCLHFLFKLTM